MSTHAFYVHPLQVLNLLDTKQIKHLKKLAGVHTQKSEQMVKMTPEVFESEL